MKLLSLSLVAIQLKSSCFPSILLRYVHYIPSSNKIHEFTKTVFHCLLRVRQHIECKSQQLYPAEALLKKNKFGCPEIDSLHSEQFSASFQECLSFRGCTRYSLEGNIKLVNDQVFAAFAVVDARTANLALDCSYMKQKAYFAFLIRTFIPRWKIKFRDDHVKR